MAEKQEELRTALVTKPWGYEYLFYEHKDIGIWFLNIEENKQTSLHAHKKKKTGLVVLDGVAEVSFLNGKHDLFPGDKIIIREGVFHRTRAKYRDVKLLEVETPQDKFDLIRLEDDYNRAGKPYETEYLDGTGVQRLIEDVWFYGNSIEIFTNNDKPEITSEHLLNITCLINNKTQIVFIEGGLYSNKISVCGPGDIIDSVSVSKMMKKFSVSEKISFIRISKAT